MKKNKKAEAKLYLKGIKSPVITLIFEDINKANCYLMEHLENKEFISVGDVIFNKNDLSYIKIK